MTDQTAPKPDTTRATTDVAEFMSDLDGGQFERLLSYALSQTAAASVDHQKKGEVVLKLKFAPIKGTSQCTVTHEMTYRKPTSMGRSSEEVNGATVLHVGKFGRISLAQPSLFDTPQQRMAG